MSQEFIHLSDPHLTSLLNVRKRDLLSKRLLSYLSWRRRRRLEHRRETLDVLTADFSKASPDQIVVTGDLTHIGLESEFRDAADWLKTLGPPEQVALVPGNHDAMVTASLGYQQRYWSDYLTGDESGNSFPSLRVRGDIAFIGLNSAVPTAPAMATGRVGEAQLEALPALLAQCRDRGLFRVIYLHHCPLHGVDRKRKCLVNATAVANTLAAGGAELVLHGHGHRDQRHNLATADGEALVMAAPSASAGGLYHGAPAAYHRLTLTRAVEGWSLNITTRELPTGSQTLKSHSTETLHLRRGHAAARSD